MSKLFEQKYNREDSIAELTLDVLKFLDTNDPDFKTKGNIIRATIEIAWRMGNREGFAQAIRNGASVVGDYETER